MDEQKQFHHGGVDVGVYAARGGLYDEAVIAADVVNHIDIQLSICEAPNIRLALLHVEALGDVVGQVRVGGAGDEANAKAGLYGRADVLAVEESLTGGHLLALVGLRLRSVT